MKKNILLAVITLTGLIATAGYVWTGAGVQLSATTTPQTYTLDTGDYAYSVSVHNAGDDTAYFTKATSTNGFSTATAIPVASGMTYTSSGGNANNEKKNRRITAITYASDGTASLNVAFE